MGRDEILNGWSDAEEARSSVPRTLQQCLICSLQVRGTRREIASISQTGIILSTSGSDVANDELYKDLAENSLGLMCAHDLTGTLLWVNRVVSDTLGCPVEAAIGRNLISFLPARMREQFPDYLERIRSNSVDSGLLGLVAANGAERI